MLKYNMDFNSRQAMHEQIIASNTLMLGALAWRGYQLKSTGAVIIYELTKNLSSFEESVDVEIGYLSKEEVVHNYPEAIGLFELVDEYKPHKEMVVSFSQAEKSLIESYRLNLMLPPSKCYILLQEKLLKSEDSKGGVFKSFGI
jgi:hypothetical protein